MTTLFAKLLVSVGPLLLLTLMAVAGYAYHQILTLNLPIPQALGLLTLVLPLITGISTQGARGLIQRSRHDQYQLTLPLIAVIGFQLIYETIIATLALTYILPPDSLACGLETRWLKLWQTKDARAIRAIQDRFDCCGFNSMKDRAWPFTSAPACTNAYPLRQQSCVANWRQTEQTTAGILLLIALIVFMLKVISLIYLLTSSSWMNGSVTRRFKQLTGMTDEDTEDNRATMRRLIEEGDRSASYRDEEEPEPSDQDQGPRVVPSPLVESNNQWREEDGRS
ncbi:hypothetical protein BP5796_10374 [Coleophoma crateriformis]|uniref:Tetraspanin Tsp3 n=1 Tax=Coleophoma crateriformis TaxID=565419 RepID=A0A3D8QQ04_9HELO|nr:hypothetical protein BP5796_10374 [Coleophoma crateriformis]